MSEHPVVSRSSDRTEVNRKLLQMQGEDGLMGCSVEGAICSLFHNKHCVKMHIERKKQQQLTKEEDVLIFHCSTEHRATFPEVANQISLLEAGQPMMSRDLVTSISQSPGVWATGAGLTCSVVPCHWSVQLSVMLQIF